jgi:hypothetical protein
MGKYNLPYKPDPTVRQSLVREGVKVFPSAELLRKKTKTLKAIESYLESYLEMVCGTQIWDILDALSAVEYELHSRNKNRQNKEEE